MSLKQIGLALLALVMLVPAVDAAEMKIAVIDSEMAVLESDASKRYAKESEKKFAPRIKLIQSLQEELQKMEADLERNAPTLSQTQVEAKQLEMRRKYEDLQMQDRQLRMDKNQADQQELSQLRPKLEKAIEEVSKELKYDMVIERGAVRYVKPDYDITRQVIERLNKMK
ncbi:hypothetical protein GZ77_04900 [Endozoicomonas montiporae]|uniref:Molecular chaperone n=2 Tax=Endozoicomonas montiporae TaxID=1027273 RepID=A0A081NBN4_9GAMM|nr:OmpH family outer membrane protein [Endozoicomonas montiporae]AMO56151.1 outer membrane protein [Endozoicomonas montiporae CL-33]KEQ15857.1 hypothetical protein GZ77_04900 [Endozoicomonas montiporae]